MNAISLSAPAIEWREDCITRRFVEENAQELINPRTMSPSSLAAATTYCKTFENPYAEELMRRAGNLSSFTEAHTSGEQMKILRNAARSFGIILI